MRIPRHSKVAMLAGIVTLANGCGTDIQAHASISSSQGTPVIIGAVTFTGSSAVVGTVLQVSLTVKNDSTAPVSFGYGPCGLNVALYPTDVDSNTSVWQTQQACQTIAQETVAAGQSLLVTASIPITEFTQGANSIALGTYNVTTYTISYGENNNFSGTLNAGTVEIQYLPPWPP